MTTPNNDNKQLEKSNSQSIGAFLKEKEKQIGMALPRHLTADKLMRIALTEINRNQLLKQCTRESLVSSIIQSSQLGLYPDSITGEAYLIPYKNNKNGNYECQFMVGYQGLLTLAYRSSQIVNVFAKEVCINDFFEFEFGTNSILKHKPCKEDRGDTIYYYAIAILKNGGSQFEVMSKSDIEKHKKHSKSSNSNYSPWATHYDEMAKKTVIKQLLKLLPRSSEDMNLFKAISLDNQADLGIQVNNIIDVDPEPTYSSKTEDLLETLDGK
jgi:recombination protein RecT